MGLAPGWPDAAPAGWVLRRDLGSVVAALAADPDADVEEVVYRGRATRTAFRTSGRSPGGLVVTIAGNADRAALLRIAESLRET